jgi:hypothetical protein
VFIEHPLENLMASFSYTSTVLEVGTALVFGSWINVANGSSGFNSHQANSRKLEAFVAVRHSNLNEFINNLDKLLVPDLAGEIERMSIFDATSIHVAPGLLGSDLNRSKEATRSKSLTDLEEDLDRVLKFGDERATACRGAPIFDNYSESDDDPESFSCNHLGLTITSTLRGRFVYWKGLEPSELLEHDSRLVAFMQELPFQEGKPLSPISKEGEGSTELVEYSHTDETSPDRQVYMASLRNADDDEPGPEYDAELLTDVSADERTADAPPGQERGAQKDLAVEEHQACPAQVENGNPRMQRNLPKEPQQHFRSSCRAGVSHTNWRHCRSSAPRSTTTTKPPDTKLQYLTQRALVQLDEQHLVSSTWNMLSKSEHRGDSAQISCTPRWRSRI